MNSTICVKKGRNMAMDKNEKYILSVKSNLRAFLYTVNYKIDEYGSFMSKDDKSVKYKTLTHLCNELQKKADAEENSFWLSKLDNKLKKLLSNENDSVDAYFINEICELYKFPIEKIYSPEQISIEEACEIMSEIILNNNIRQKPFAPISKLTHKSYFGNFYGYTLDHNPNEEETIIKFDLSIYEDEDFVPRAEYVFYNRNNEKQVFTGIPYYMPESKTIIIEMTANNHRRHQYLYFNGTPYNSDKLTYKNGVCVRTSTASVNHEPDVKSFVITGCKQTEDVEKNIIPGLLKMTADDFYILSSELDKIEAENTDVKAFHEKNSADFKLIDDAVYLIKERKLIENTKYESKAARISAFEILTTIKSHSLAPNKIIYRNAEADYNYFKEK